MKTCSKCGHTRPLSEFHKQRGTRDGHRSQCKECRKVQPPPPTPPPKNKTCTKCGRTRPLSDFPNEKKGKHGKSAQCANCKAARMKSYRQRPEVKARENKRHRQRRKRPDVIQSLADYASTPARKAYMKLYAAMNRGKTRKSSSKWNAANKGKMNSYKAAYRTKKTAAGGSHTAKEWRDLCAKYGGRCLKCGRTDRPLQRDHIIPVSHGGHSNIDNIQPLCGSCNKSKGTKHTDYRWDG